MTFETLKLEPYIVTTIVNKHSELTSDSDIVTKMLNIILILILLNIIATFFFSGTKHPREDNPNLYYWAEMTGLHTQTFNI